MTRSATVAEEFQLSFRWHDRFLVGHAAIDAEHRDFFARLNAAAVRMECLTGTLERTTLLWEIVETLGRHFVAEECVLEAVGFTRLAEHRSTHRALAEQAGAALSIACDGEWRTALRLLSTTVLEHVVLEDAELRQCFAAAACLFPPVPSNPPPRRALWPGH